MRSLLLAPYYLHWHYSRALQGIYTITGNLIWFIWHFFSIGILAGTLFDPWQRLQEHSEKKFDLSEMASTFLINTVMRFVGLLIRTIFILIGLIAMAIVAIGGIAVGVVWLVMPVLIPFLFVFGFTLLLRMS